MEREESPRVPRDIRRVVGFTLFTVYTRNLSAARQAGTPDSSLHASWLRGDPSWGAPNFNIPNSSQSPGLEKVFSTLDSSSRSGLN